MNGAKIHRDENGFETFVCSKCKDKKERLNGIQTEKSKKTNKPRYKWLCDMCLASYISKMAY
jgi:hypothetical protein